MDEFKFLSGYKGKDVEFSDPVPLRMFLWCVFHCKSVKVDA